MKAQVLLPKIFNFSFTYETKKEKLTPGDIVEVPFGKEKATGVVWPDKIFAPKDIKIKNIHKKIGKISLNKHNTCLGFFPRRCFSHITFVRITLWSPTEIAGIAVDDRGVVEPHEDREDRDVVPSRY